MASGFPGIFTMASADGPTLTAAAAASCLPVTAKQTFAPNGFAIPCGFRIFASGRISCVVTTPGTARLDIRLNNNVILDTGALNLNVVAKTILPWTFEARMTCRALGATGNFWGIAEFTSEAVVGSPLNTAGGNGGLLAPVGGTAVGSNVDLTVANPLDMFFTQTVATGSFTVHQFWLETIGIALA